MNLYGYSKENGDAILELVDVSICLSIEEAKKLRTFLDECIIGMSNNAEWDHEHFPDDIRLAISKLASE
jgi:hypothetical protein